MGATAPINEAVVEVAHRIERKELQPDVANPDLLLGAAAARGPGDPRYDDRPVRPTSSPQYASNE